MAETGTKQQEELLRRQEQLQQAHDHLVENSKIILAAQVVTLAARFPIVQLLDYICSCHTETLCYRKHLSPNKQACL